MSFYTDRILPHLLNLAMRHKELAAYRQRVVPAAQGRVLEIGIGSGLNLPFYVPGVDAVIGLDPSSPLLAMVQGQATASASQHVQGTAEAIRWRLPAWTRLSPHGRSLDPECDGALADIAGVSSPTACCCL